MKGLLQFPASVEKSARQASGRVPVMAFVADADSERVVQDVEVPIERTCEFVEWFLEEQVEEESTMQDLLAVAERTREIPMLLEEYVAREHSVN